MADDSFAGRVAERYDETLAEMFAPEVVDPVVAFLAERAGEGPALELGIGTGRIALPLARRGVRLKGIDRSPDMVAQLRAKRGGAEIPVTIGDFATTVVGGPFSLAYAVWNTIMNLRTQDAQITCFRNVAAQLQPHGCFVVETMLPELQRLPPRERFLPFDVSPDHLGFDEYDVVRQGLTSHHYYLREGEYATFPGRYVWPSELDLIARLAGMSLRERWGGWKGEPFTSESRSHVSVYEQASSTRT
jgi:SAM-dependent methyltransferase